MARLDGTSWHLLMHQYGLSRLVNVVLTKEKRALVFAMTHDSIDDWTYKFVESVVPFDLKTPSGILKFAHVLMSALKWADHSEVD